MVKNGKLVPTGEEGEFKAIYKDNGARFTSVSVDIYPGEKGINAGLYINAYGVGHKVDEIKSLAVLVESDFPHNGEEPWEDAANRVDLIVGEFPAWKELSRVISETGKNNNLFFDGNKEPLNLKVEIDGNKLTITLSLISDPTNFVQTTYVYEDAEDLSLGNVGIRSNFNDSSYDDFVVEFLEAENNDPDNGEKPDNGSDPDNGEEPDNGNNPDDGEDPDGSGDSNDCKDPETPADKVTFDTADSADKFDFYHSSNGGFVVKDGRLVPSGEEGEFKAIYKDTNGKFTGISVDIYPGEDGINSGIYIGASKVDHGVDKIKALAILVESNFSGWDDAVNRIDLVVGQFPIWKELSRYTSETGADNALFAGSKEPVNLRVDIDGKIVTIKLSLLSDPSKYITTTYEYNGTDDLSLGDVGLRSAFNGASFDNFTVYGELGTSDKEPDGSTAPGTGDHAHLTDVVLLAVASLAATLCLAWLGIKNKCT